MEFTITQGGAHSLAFQGYKAHLNVRYPWCTLLLVLLLQDAVELKHRFASNLPVVSIEEYMFLLPVKGYIAYCDSLR